MIRTLTLAITALTLTGTAYAAPRRGEGDVAQFEFIPWVLAQCASVSEARVLLEPAVRTLTDRDKRMLYLRFYEERARSKPSTPYLIIGGAVAALIAIAIFVNVARF